jgi:hypothetical protein
VSAIPSWQFLPEDLACSVAPRQVRESGPLFQVESIGTRFKDPALTQRFQRALRTAGM